MASESFQLCSLHGRQGEKSHFGPEMCLESATAGCCQLRSLQNPLSLGLAWCNGRPAYLDHSTTGACEVPLTGTGST